MSLKRQPGRWALNYTQCIRCEQSDTKHMGKGLCRRCYFADYNRDNLAAIQKYKNQWYRKSGGASWSKALREQQNYGGNREAALKRDGYKCVKCGATTRLCVHHKDGKGRNVAVPLKNNALDNLETLCLACHINLHRSAMPRPTLEKRQEATRRGWIARRANQNKK